MIMQSLPKNYIHLTSSDYNWLHRKLYAHDLHMLVYLLQFVQSVRYKWMQQLFLVLPEHNHARMWKGARRCQFQLAERFASPCGASRGEGSKIADVKYKSYSLKDVMMVWLKIKHIKLALRDSSQSIFIQVSKKLSPGIVSWLELTGCSKSGPRNESFCTIHHNSHWNGLGISASVGFFWPASGHRVVTCGHLPACHLGSAQLLQ